MKPSRLVYLLALLVGIGWTPLVGAWGQDVRRQPLDEDLSRPRLYRLEMISGEGYGLCETLLDTGRRLHPNGEYAPLEPVLTWKQILGIPGIAEPAWTDLDPTQHERLFARLYDLYELRSTGHRALGNLNKADLFFARHRYASLCARGKACTLPPHVRRTTTLEGYRDFVEGGGRMRMYPVNIGSKEAPSPAAVVQYEYVRYPDWTAFGFSFERTEWLGFTFYAKPDLGDRITDDATSIVHAGPDKRLLLYQGRPHIVDIGGRVSLSAKYLLWPHSECQIAAHDTQVKQ
jgi:hypothetical protein